MLFFYLKKSTCCLGRVLEGYKLPKIAREAAPGILCKDDRFCTSMCFQGVL